jgi:hypothetical protein
MYLCANADVSSLIFSNIHAHVFIQFMPNVLPVMAVALALDEQIGDSMMAPPLPTTAVLFMNSELLISKMPPAVTRLPPPPATMPESPAANNIHHVSNTDR